MANKWGNHDGMVFQKYQDDYGLHIDSTFRRPSADSRYQTTSRTLEDYATPPAVDNEVASPVDDHRNYRDYRDRPDDIPDTWGFKDFKRNGSGRNSTHSRSSGHSSREGSRTREGSRSPNPSLGRRTPTPSSRRSERSLSRDNGYSTSTGYSSLTLTPPVPRSNRWSQPELELMMSSGGETSLEKGTQSPHPKRPRSTPIRGPPARNVIYYQNRFITLNSNPDQGESRSRASSATSSILSSDSVIETQRETQRENRRPKSDSYELRGFQSSSEGVTVTKRSRSQSDGIQENRGYQDSRQWRKLRLLRKQADDLIHGINSSSANNNLASNSSTSPFSFEEYAAVAGPRNSEADIEKIFEADDQISPQCSADDNSTRAPNRPLTPPIEEVDTAEEEDVPDLPINKDPDMAMKADPRSDPRSDMDATSVSMENLDETKRADSKDSVEVKVTKKKNATLQRIFERLQDNRVVGKSGERLVLGTGRGEHVVLKKVLNIIFLTVGSALFLAVIVVIIYTSVVPDGHTITPTEPTSTGSEST